MCIHVFRVRNNRYNWKKNLVLKKSIFIIIFIDFSLILLWFSKNLENPEKYPEEFLNESLTKWANLKSTLSEHNLANFIVINKRFLQGLQKMYFTHRKLMTYEKNYFWTFCKIDFLIFLRIFHDFHWFSLIFRWFLVKKLLQKWKFSTFFSGTKT